MQAHVRLLSALALCCLLLPAGARAQDEDTVAHLKGISYVYMDVDTSLAGEVDSYVRQDLSDIVELQLLRGNIIIRPPVANVPEANYPMVRIVVDTSRPMGRNQFLLRLQVRDNVTIRRNGEQTIATTFEIERIGTAQNSDQLESAIKAQLRELMLDFVTSFRTANPG